MFRGVPHFGDSFSFGFTNTPRGTYPTSTIMHVSSNTYGDPYANGGFPLILGIILLVSKPLRVVVLSRQLS